MKRFPLISAVLLLTISESNVFGDADNSQLVSRINTLDKQSVCHLAVRKILKGDTDRGMEATLYACTNGVERIEIIFGLSRKDLMFRYILVNGRAAKAEVLERKYRSTADADPDFKNPLSPTSRAILYFDGPRVISIVSGEILHISEKNENAKAVAFMNLVNAVRGALISGNPHPEFESISFLTGIFGNG